MESVRYPAVTVLVVEDEPTHRKILEAQLRALGVGLVLTAADGYDALEQLAADPTISLIISDLDMPRLDGLELLCQHAKSKHKASFVLHSAMDRQLLACMQLMAHEREFNFLGVLTKPAPPKDLLAMLERGRSVPLPSRKPLPETTAAERIDGLACGQFEPFFQPKVRFADGRVVGAEVLARWRHPTHGVLPPAAFIDAFEAEGRLPELTDVMMRRAFEAASRWRDEGRSIPVSVNLSLSSLSDAGAALRIEAIASAAGLVPDLVMLEITENVAMTDVGTCLENIARLRLRGFRFSIDDFGVGYSSLQQLVRMPFDEIKIDRSFVMGVRPQSRQALMLELTIAMARKLEMKTVAEGIETQREWDFLADLGCEVAQGYFVSRPISAEEFTAWHRERG